MSRRMGSAMSAGSGRADSSWIEATTLGDLLERTAARHPDLTALSFGQEMTSYGELAVRSDRVACGLVSRGVGPGECVGYLMHNSADLVATLFGIARAGGVVVAINARLTPNELGHLVRVLRLAAIVTHAGPSGAPDLEARAREAVSALEEPRPLLLICENGNLRDGLARDVAPRDEASASTLAQVRARRRRVRVRDIAMVLPTSGTTGLPKGCLLTHEAFVRPGVEMAQDRFMLTPEDRLWDPLPLFHLGGLAPLLGCVSAGAAFCGAGHFRPDEALEQLERMRCTVGYPVWETIWLQVVRNERFATTRFALRELHLVGVPERLHEFQRALPSVPITSSYGTSEGAPAAYTTTVDPPKKRLETVGRPSPGTELRILDPVSGTDQPAGVSGEIVYRGFHQFEGYFEDAESSAEVLRNGWVYSGDLGFLDDDGYLVYEGRLKEVLKVGGENVAAFEIENVLLQHDAVGIARVVGAPDRFYTEVPVAFVELAGGASATEEELIAHCQHHLARFKVPQHVRFVAPDQWPMSATKIQKLQLKKQIAAELARQ